MKQNYRMYVSTKSGVTMSKIAWLQVIADKQFHLEYSLSSAERKAQTKKVFEALLKDGILEEIA